MIYTRKACWGIGMLCLLLTMPFACLQAQVTLSSNAGQLTNAIKGTGIAVSNVQFTGSSASTAIYNKPNSNLPIESGILLTTGKAQNAFGTNSSTNYSYSASAPGDADISALIGGQASYDAAVLEFDVIPAGDSLKLDFFFASEEYPEKVCANYNDRFLIQITGGGLDENLALIPGTTEDVGINTVNVGAQGSQGSLTNLDCELAYTQYFVNNATGLQLQYDGYTKKINVAKAITPCQTYHIKIVIADTDDDLGDSGLFIQAGSLRSGETTYSVRSTIDTIYEYCKSSTVIVEKNDNLGNASNLNFAWEGSASLNTDFTTTYIGTNISFPAGKDTIQFEVAALADNNAEGVENIFVALQDGGCAGAIPNTTDTIVLSETRPENNLSQSNLVCFKDGSGKVYNSPNIIGNSASSYIIDADLNETAFNDSILNLDAGTYFIYTIDDEACESDSNQVIITQPDSMSFADIQIVGNTCYGDQGGSLEIKALGGTAAYMFNWLDNSKTLFQSIAGNPTASITGLASGTYFLYVNDSENCKSDTIELEIPSIPVPKVWDTHTNPSCHENEDGAFQLFFQNITPVDLQWTTNGTALTQYEDSTSIDSLANGVYSVVVTTDKNCQYSHEVDIVAPSPLTATYTLGNVLCAGDNNVGVSFSVQGGKQPYSFEWSDGLVSSLPSRSGLGAGTYSLEVKDSNACVFPITFDIESPLALSITHTESNPTCSYLADASIAWQGSGGSLPYSFKWYKEDVEFTNGATAQFDNLEQGNYKVQLTDVNGCTLISNSINLVAPNPIAATFTSSNVNCHEGTDGNITTLSSGGTGTLNYNWTKYSDQSFTETSQNLNNLSAGIYQLTVSDDNNCSFSIENIVVEEPNEPLSWTISTTDLTCFENTSGQITTTVTGGTAPYNYLWEDGSTTTFRNDLIAGDYSLTVTDDKNCSLTSGAIEITEPTVLAATYATTPLTCHDAGNATIQLTVNGGTAPYAYNWTNNAGNIINTNTDNLSLLQAGIYKVTISDSNNCTLIFNNINIENPEPINLSYTTDSVICKGQSNGDVYLQVANNQGDYTVNWHWLNNSDNFANTTSLTSIQAGSYAVTVTDDNECTANLTNIVVGEPSESLQANLELEHLSCFESNDAWIEVSTTGGTGNYIFQWTGSSSATSEDLQNLAAGTYYLEIQDERNCTWIDTAVLTQPELLEVSISQENPSCFGENNGFVQLATTGGTWPYTYTWSGSANQAVTQSGNALEDATAGSYIVQIKDANNCTIDTSTILTQPDNLVISIQTDSVDCFSDSTGSIDLSVVGGTMPYVFNWAGSDETTESLQNLASDIYYVTVTDNQNCNFISNAIEVGTYPLIEIDYQKTDLTCHDDSTGSIVLNVIGGTTTFTYEWSDGGNGMNLASGQYFLTVTDALACTATIDEGVSILEPAPFQFTKNSKNISCNKGTDGHIKIFPEGGIATIYNYNWSTGGINSFIEDLEAGNYSLTLSDGNMCEEVHDFILTQPDTINVDSLTADALCKDGEDGYIKITPTGGALPYTWNWTIGDSLLAVDKSLLSGLTAGQYHLSLTDANDCIWEADYQISEPDSLLMTANLRLPDCAYTKDGNIELEVTGGTLPYTFDWISPNGTYDADYISNLDTGFYYLQILDSNDCIIDTIFHLPSQDLDYCFGLNIYNVVSPKGSAANSYWHIGEIEFYPLNSVKLFNRQGQILWDATGYDNENVRFEGKDRYDKELPSGTYFYQIFIQKDKLAEKQEYKGWIQIF